MVFCCRQVKIRILEFLAVQKLRGAACAIGFEVGFNLCRFIVWKSGFMWIYGFTILWYWVYGGYTYTYTYIQTYIYIDKQIIYIYILSLHFGWCCRIWPPNGCGWIFHFPVWGGGMEPPWKPQNMRWNTWWSKRGGLGGQRTSCEVALKLGQSGPQIQVPP